MRIQDYLNQCDKELDPYYTDKLPECDGSANLLFWLVVVAVVCAVVWTGAEIVKFLMNV